VKRTNIYNYFHIVPTNGSLTYICVFNDWNNLNRVMECIDEMYQIGCNNLAFSSKIDRLHNLWTAILLWSALYD
jgi:hypothetical protein